MDHWPRSIVRKKAKIPSEIRGASHGASKDAVSLRREEYAHVQKENIHYELAAMSSSHPSMQSCRAKETGKNTKQTHRTTQGRGHFEAGMEG